jgi:hypothetical protein
MYTKAAVWATSATPLPMWDVEGSGMVPLPNMVADFRDTVLQGKAGILWQHEISQSINVKNILGEGAQGPQVTATAFGPCVRASPLMLSARRSSLRWKTTEHYCIGNMIIVRERCTSDLH